jgi:hypothetical protein
LWGSGCWLDARSWMNVRLYDYALYADARAVCVFAFF